MKAGNFRAPQHREVTPGSRVLPPSSNSISSASTSTPALARSSTAAGDALLSSYGGGRSGTTSTGGRARSNTGGAATSSRSGNEDYLARATALGLKRAPKRAPTPSPESSDFSSEDEFVPLARAKSTSRVKESYGRHSEKEFDRPNEKTSSNSKNRPAPVSWASLPPPSHPSSARARSSSVSAATARARDGPVSEIVTPPPPAEAKPSAPAPAATSLFGSIWSKLGVGAAEETHVTAPKPGEELGKSKKGQELPIPQAKIIPFTLEQESESKPATTTINKSLEIKRAETVKEASTTKFVDPVDLINLPKRSEAGAVNLQKSTSDPTPRSKPKTAAQVLAPVEPITWHRPPPLHPRDQFQLIPKSRGRGRTAFDWLQPTSHSGIDPFLFHREPGRAATRKPRNARPQPQTAKTDPGPVQILYAQSATSQPAPINPSAYTNANFASIPAYSVQPTPQQIQQQQQQQYQQAMLAQQEAQQRAAAMAQYEQQRRVYEAQLAAYQTQLEAIKTANTAQTQLPPPAVTPAPSVHYSPAQIVPTPVAAATSLAPMSNLVASPPPIAPVALHASAPAPQLLPYAANLQVAAPVVTALHTVTTRPEPAAAVNSAPAIPPTQINSPPAISAAAVPAPVVEKIPGAIPEPALTQPTDPQNVAPAVSGPIPPEPATIPSTTAVRISAVESNSLETQNIPPQAAQVPAVTAVASPPPPTRSPSLSTGFGYNPAIQGPPVPPSSPKPPQFAAMPIEKALPPPPAMPSWASLSAVPNQKSGSIIAPKADSPKPVDRVELPKIEPKLGEDLAPAAIQVQLIPPTPVEAPQVVQVGDAQVQDESPAETNAEVEEEFDETEKIDQVPKLPEIVELSWSLPDLGLGLADNGPSLLPPEDFFRSLGQSETSAIVVPEKSEGILPLPERSASRVGIVPALRFEDDDGESYLPDVLDDAASTLLEDAFDATSKFVTDFNQADVLPSADPQHYNRMKKWLVQQGVTRVDSAEQFSPLSLENSMENSEPESDQESNDSLQQNVGMDKTLLRPGLYRPQTAPPTSIPPIRKQNFLPSLPPLPAEHRADTAPAAAEQRSNTSSEQPVVKAVPTPAAVIPAPSLASRSVSPSLPPGAGSISASLPLFASAPAVTHQPPPAVLTPLSLATKVAQLVTERDEIDETNAPSPTCASIEDENLLVLERPRAITAQFPSVVFGGKLVDEKEEFGAVLAAGVKQNNLSNQAESSLTSSLPILPESSQTEAVTALSPTTSKVIALSKLSNSAFDNGKVQDSDTRLNLAGTTSAPKLSSSPIERKENLADEFFANW